MTPPPRIMDTLYPDEVHMIPLNDLREHEASGGCWCYPSREERQHMPDDWCFVWTHRPLDRRDLLTGASLQ